MNKKILKLFSTIMIVCLLVPTVVQAEEPLQNLSYEEYLERQENEGVSENIERDLTPVYAESQKIEDQSVESQSYIIGNDEMQVLASVASKHIELPQGIDKAKIADGLLPYEVKQEKTKAASVKSISDNVTISGNIVGNEAVKAIPVASLIPIIVNEDSLVNGNISTETLIAFFFNDTDEDGNAITNRYVGGSAANFIIGEVDGGFVVNITVAGSYVLLYQVEDSSGELSEVIGFNIDVVDASADKGYQIFEGNFSSVEDSKTYNFSIDFSQMDSAAVCLVRKGYVGTSVQVFDENNDRVVYRGTQMGQPKNWQYIDKPSTDAGICNYSMVVTPNTGEFGNGANDYRIIVGDKNETELMMSGIENTVLLEHYREGDSRVENAQYLPNVGEYWYKFRANNETITVLNNAGNLRFKIKSINNIENDMFDSAQDANTHKTKFTGSGGWTCAEKARLNTTVGTEYYLVVYCTLPNESIALREGSMGTAVGYPVMLAGNTTIYPNRSVTMNSTGYSSMSFAITSGSSIPVTGQVVDMDLHGITMSNVDRWRLMAPNKSFWVNNKGTCHPTVDMNYVQNTSNNARLVGTWQAAFKATSSDTTKTFTPYFTVTYYCEYGDE